jgi:hypothetical protein
MAEKNLRGQEGQGDQVCESLLAGDVDHIEWGRVGMWFDGASFKLLIFCISYLGVKVGDFNGLFTGGREI